MVVLTQKRGKGEEDETESTRRGTRSGIWLNGKDSHHGSAGEEGMFLKEQCSSSCTNHLVSNVLLRGKKSGEKGHRAEKKKETQGKGDEKTHLESLVILSLSGRLEGAKSTPKE